MPHPRIPSYFYLHTSICVKFPSWTPMCQWCWCSPTRHTIPITKSMVNLLAFSNLHSYAYSVCDHVTLDIWIFAWLVVLIWVLVLPKNNFSSAACTMCLCTVLSNLVNVIVKHCFGIYRNNLLWLVHADLHQSLAETWHVWMFKCSSVNVDVCVCVCGRGERREE